MFHCVPFCSSMSMSESPLYPSKWELHFLLLFFSFLIKRSFVLQFVLPVSFVSSPAKDPLPLLLLLILFPLLPSPSSSIAKLKGEKVFSCHRRLCEVIKVFSILRLSLHSLVTRIKTFFSLIPSPSSSSYLFPSILRCSLVIEVTREEKKEMKGMTMKRRGWRMK